MTQLRQDVIDRRAYQVHLELDTTQQGYAASLLAKTAIDLTPVRPSSQSIVHNGYRLNDRFTLDADATITDDSRISGNVHFIDQDRKVQNQLQFTRLPHDFLWRYRSTDPRAANSGMANVPNEAIITELRNAAPDIPIDAKYLGIIDDLTLFCFLAHALKKSGGKKRSHTQEWVTHEVQPHLRDGRYNSDLMRHFSTDVVNGSLSYTLRTRTPGLPTKDGHRIVTEHMLNVKNVGRKDQKVGASIVHLGLYDELGEESGLTAWYAAEGSRVDPNDFLLTAETSADKLVRRSLT